MKFKILNNEISNIHSAAFLMGAAGLLSRVLGVLRDRLLAGHFGAGRELDAYYAAFQLPDFMSVIFLLGAGSAAILPVFQEYFAKDRIEAERLIAGLVQVFLLAATGVAVLIFLFAPLLMRFVAPGFSDADRALTVMLTRIMVLSPIFLGLSSIFSSVVQSFKRFVAYALAPVLYNIGIILGIVLFVPAAGIRGVAIGVVLGALMHMLIQLEAVLSADFRFRFSLEEIRSHFHHAGIQKILKFAFPRFLAISLFNITLIVLVALGSTLARGSIALFQLAYNLYFVPIGIVGLSYAMALFPAMHKSYLDRNGRKFHQELFLGIRTIFFWIAPSVALYIVLRAHIVRAALGTGAFSWENTRLAAASLAAFSIAMLGGSISTLLIRSYYALENTRLPLIINAFSALVSIGAAYAFTRLLLISPAFAAIIKNLFRISDIPYPGVVGLALGFSLGLTLDAVCLYIALRILAKKTFQISEPFPLLALAKIFAGALLAGVTAYSVRVSFSQTLPLITFAKVVEQALLAGIGGFLVYFLMLYLLRSEEVEAAILVFRRRLFKAGVLPKSWDREDLPLQ